MKLRHNDRQNIALYSILCIKTHFIIFLNFQIWEKTPKLSENMLYMIRMHMDLFRNHLGHKAKRNPRAIKQKS